MTKSDGIIKDGSILRLGTGTKWEPGAGYVGAVRSGPLITIAGTLAIGPDGNPIPGAYEQAKHVFTRVVELVKELGGEARHIVRTRMFVRGILENSAEMARAHKEVFGDHPPATTMVEIISLIEDGFLIECEADAYVTE